MKKTIRVNDIIFDKIKFRYHFMNSGRVSDRKRNNKALMDSFYPYQVAKSIKDKREIEGNINGKKGYCISQRV